MDLPEEHISFCDVGDPDDDRPATRLAVLLSLLAFGTDWQSAAALCAFETRRHAGAGMAITIGERTAGVDLFDVAGDLAGETQRLTLELIGPAPA